MDGRTFIGPHHMRIKNLTAQLERAAKVLENFKERDAHLARIEARLEAVEALLEFDNLFQTAEQRILGRWMIRYLADGAKRGGDLKRDARTALNVSPELCYKVSKILNVDISVADRGGFSRFWILPKSKFISRLVKIIGAEEETQQKRSNA